MMKYTSRKYLFMYFFGFNYWPSIPTTWKKYQCLGLLHYGIGHEYRHFISPTKSLYGPVLEALRVSIVVQQVKLLLAMPASCIRVPIWVLAALLLIQFSAIVVGKAVDDDPSTWTPTTYMCDLDGVLDACLQPGPLQPCGEGTSG